MAKWGVPDEAQAEILARHGLDPGGVAVNDLGEGRFVALCYKTHRQYYYSNGTWLDA